LDELPWRRSSHSGDGSNCVEVAATATTVRIRDSKAEEKRHLVLSADAWTAFLGLTVGT
jgi:hypothetical protein